MSLHVQCRVQRGNEFMVTWLPKEFAQLGRFLKLKDRAGDLSDGWCVINTYSELDSKVVQARALGHRKAREATDF